MNPASALRTVLLAAAACAAVPAAELVVKDLGVSLAALPAAFDYRLDSPTLSRSGSDGFASGTELALGGRYGFARPGDAIGLVVGADLATDTWTYDGNGVLASVGVRLSAGLGWAITDDWTLLADPGLRYGVSSIDLPDSSSSGGFTGSGTYSGYDTRIALLWQIRPGLLLTAHGGWISQTSDLSGDGIDLSLDQSGLQVGLGVVWRWSTAPPRIE